MNGWLVGQLPSVMIEDPVIEAFALAAEAIGDSFRSRLDGIEHQLDAHLASPDMLAYLAGWLGFPLDELDGADFNALVLPVIGQILKSRGTATALRQLLEALSGGSVDIVDPGGIYGPAEPVPPYDSLVRIRFAQEGIRGRERLVAILEREVPVGVRVDVSWSVTAAEES